MITSVTSFCCVKRLRRLITEYVIRGIVLYLVHREHVGATYTFIYCWL